MKLKRARWLKKADEPRTFRFTKNKQTNKNKTDKQKHVFSTIHMPIDRLYPTLSTNINKLLCENLSKLLL